MASLKKKEEKELIDHIRLSSNQIVQQQQQQQRNDDGDDDVDEKKSGEESSHFIFVPSPHAVSHAERVAADTDESNIEKKQQQQENEEQGQHPVEENDDVSSDLENAIPLPMSDPRTEILRRNFQHCSMSGMLSYRITAHPIEDFDGVGHVPLCEIPPITSSSSLTDAEKKQQRLLLTIRSIQLPRKGICGQPPDLSSADRDWPALRVLDLSSNDMEGIINISSLPHSLTHLNLANNEGLMGKLETERLPKNLVSLNLQRCLRFFGSFEFSFKSSCPNLRSLDLSMNRFSGPIHLADAFPDSLQVLRLNHNYFGMLGFDGPESPSLSTTTKATPVEQKLIFNVLRGLPAELQVLTLNANRFGQLYELSFDPLGDGKIPKNLTTVNIEHNGLCGAEPSSALLKHFSSPGAEFKCQAGNFLGTSLCVLA